MTPISTCVECDAVAVAHHGSLAYCRRHLKEAQREDPDAHRCPICKEEQPPHVSWRGEPCGSCKQARKENP